MCHWQYNHKHISTSSCAWDFCHQQQWWWWALKHRQSIIYNNNMGVHLLIRFLVLGTLHTTPYHCMWLLFNDVLISSFMWMLIVCLLFNMHVHMFTIIDLVLYHTTWTHTHTIFVHFREQAQQASTIFIRLINCITTY